VVSAVFINITDLKPELRAHAPHLFFELGLERKLVVFHGFNEISRDTNSALEVDRCSISWEQEHLESGSGIGFVGNLEETLRNISTLPLLKFACPDSIGQSRVQAYYIEQYVYPYLLCHQAKASL